MVNFCILWGYFILWAGYLCPVSCWNQTCGFNVRDGPDLNRASGFQLFVDSWGGRRSEIEDCKWWTIGPLVSWTYVSLPASSSVSWRTCCLTFSYSLSTLLDGPSVKLDDEEVESFELFLTTESRECVCIISSLEMTFFQRLPLALVRVSMEEAPESESRIILLRDGRPFLRCPFIWSLAVPSETWQSWSDTEQVRQKIALALTFFIWQVCSATIITGAIHFKAVEIQIWINFDPFFLESGFQTTKSSFLISNGFPNIV